MAISNEQLDKFISIYEKKYGSIPDRQTAYDEACRLVRFVRLTCFGKVPERCKINMPGTEIEDSSEAIEHSEG
jgi:hypothetical protein